MTAHGHRLGQWATVSSKVVHENPYYYVKEDQVVRPDGTAGVYYVVSGSDTVVIVAVDLEHRVFLIELLRYTIGELSIELPMGALDGDEPLVAAKRELQEETGLVALEWKQLGVLHPDNGIRDSSTYVFLATQLTLTESHDQDAEGITKTMRVPLMEAIRMIHDGGMSDAESVGPLVMAAIELGLLA